MKLNFGVLILPGIDDVDSCMTVVMKDGVGNLTPIVTLMRYYPVTVTCNLWVTVLKLPQQYYIVRHEV